MNAQDLKNSILQLAIQGKLVEQRKEEGTAKELLEQIKAEKEQLIKDGKIKKEKPLPQISEDEIPFDIPESWEWIRLGDLSEKIGSGSTPTGGKSVYKESGIKFLRSQNIYNDGLRMEGIVYISEEQNKQGSIVKPRDILLNITGGSIGRSALVPDDFDIANINQHVMIIRNLVSENRFFLHYTLISPYIQSMIMSVQVGVSREGLSAEKAKKFLIPLPTLEEQKRIVAKIEELMPYVEKYGEAHYKLEVFNKKFPEDMQKSILQCAIQGKLVEQRKEEGTAEELYMQIQEEKAKLIKEGKIKKEKPLAEITEDEIPFEVPESWKWVRLGSLSALITKGSSPSWQGIKYTDKGLLFVTSENVGVEKLLLDAPKYLEERFNEIQERSILKKGDILTNIVGASIGRTAIFDRDELANINQAVCLIRLIDKGLNDYIAKYLNSYVAYKIMMNDKVDTARANISLTNISNFIVPLPPIMEQNRIVKRVDELLPYSKQLVK